MIDRCRTCTDAAGPSGYCETCREAHEPGVRRYSHVALQRHGPPGCGLRDPDRHDDTETDRRPPTRDDQ